MKTNRAILFARVLVASAACAFGIATIVASGGGSSGGTDEQGNPLPAGAATWFKSFGGPNDDIAYSAIPTRDGGYAFAGMLNDNGQTGDLWLTKLDTFGDVQWQRAYGKRALLEDGLWSHIQLVPAPVQGPDGSIWFLGAGKLDSAVGSRNDLVVAKLGADGNPAWARSFDGGAHPDFPFNSPGDEAVERGEAVSPTSDGGALVAAWSYVRVGIPEGSASVLREVRYLWLLKLSSTGFLQWTRRFTDDQFLYVKSKPYHWSEGLEQERIAVRELGNGDLLVNVITRLSDAFCPECEIVEFTSTRLLHLRSGGELVVNARVPYERITLPFEAHDRMSERDLPAAVAIDTDGNGTAEGYLLAGRGTDVEDIPAIGDITIDERAMVTLLGTNGVLAREEFYDEWPDGTAFATIDRKCLVGTECGYLLSGTTSANEQCHREPLIAEIDSDLEFERSYTLVRENEAAPCFNLVPVRMDIEIPSDDPTARDITLIGMGPSYASGNRTPFGEISVRLLSSDTLTGSFVSTLLDSWELSVSVTPDGQSLGVVNSGAPLFIQELVRTTSSGDVTLSRTLSADEDLRATYDAGFAIVQVDDQGFVIVGETTSFEGPHDSSLWAIRTDRDGRLLWQRKLAGLTRSAHSIPNMVASGAGVFFGAYNKANGGPVVVKLDLTGDIAWLSALPGGNCDPCDMRIAMLPNGDVLAAGTGWTGRRDTPWLARVSGAGTIAWMRRFDFPQWSFSDIDVLPNGDALVVGRRGGTASAWRFTAEGDPIWNRTYAVDSLEAGLSMSARGEGAMRAEPLADGGFLAAMTVRVEYGEDNVLLVRADTEGAAQWQRLIGARFSEVLHELKALGDGGALLAGKSNSLGDREEAWIARLGPDGRVAAGCNTGIAEFSHRLGTAMEVGTLRLRRATLAAVERPEPDASSFTTNASEFLPSASEVVVARQCSGTAGPENPGPPPARFQLTVTAGGASPGVITSSPPGISCGTVGGPCASQFDSGAVVILRPDTVAIRRLEQWSGCDSTEAGFCIVRMTGNRSVSVTFRDDTPRAITITSIAGDGRLSDGAGLNCANGAGGLQGTCSASYLFGEEITLIAVPGAGQHLQSWGGDCVGGADPHRARLVMTDNRRCSAVFSGAPAGSPTLRINPEALENGNPVDPSTIGRVTSSVPGIDCGADCSERYPQHSNVTVNADVLPAMSADWEFERFVCPLLSIDQIGARSASVQMTGDVTCTARFRNTIRRLHLDITNENSTGRLGRVVSQPTELDCTDDCDRPFDTNTTVILRARPLNIALFRSWQGCDSVFADPDPGVVPPLPGQPVPPVCQVLMNATRNVAAFFEPVSIGGDSDRTLTVSFAGPGLPEGFVQSTPPGILCSTQEGSCSNGFLVGTVVRLVVTLNTGTLFDRFVGCTRDNPDGNPATLDCEVDMVDDRAVQVRLMRP